MILSRIFLLGCAKFCVAEKAVVVVVFDLNSCKVQKYLVDKYHLVGHIYTNYFFVGYYCSVVGVSQKKS